MCLFPFSNNNIKSEAYKKGVTELSCGSCPECLQQKSRMWALRASMEAKVNKGMMLTLTYDNYIYDERGNIIGETVSDRNVDKKDCQDFFKRLRYYFPDKQIKYICTAEYGKRTRRPHYHCLIFGLVFDDLVKYKKSKRGNLIYRSKTLEKIWHTKDNNGGICTVDCVNLSAKTARYCTKYCSKDFGIDDTFMLFSRGIGEEMLLKNFNARSYWIEGREYSIPRQIWNKFLSSKKRFNVPVPRYLSLEQCLKRAQKKVDKIHRATLKKLNNSPFSNSDIIDLLPSDALADLLPKALTNVDNLLVQRLAEKEFYKNVEERKRFRELRDSSPLYKYYLSYWSKKADITQKLQKPVLDRLNALDNSKYFSYKQAALRTYKSRLLNKWNIDCAELPPRSNSIKRYMRARERFLKASLARVGMRIKFALPPSRHLRANDRNYRYFQFKKDYCKLLDLCKLD